MSRDRSVSARLAEWFGLNRVPRLKNAIKAFIYAAQDPLGRGLPLAVGGVEIRVPSRFAREPWLDYESASTRQVAGWLATRPNAILLDVGSSVGLYSLLALASSPHTTAFAFDSDPVSLNATAWLCAHTDVKRLKLVFGFVSDRPDSARDAQSAHTETAQLLSNTDFPREPAFSAYVCLDGTARPEIPVNSIDALFPAADDSRPWLLKCDVEGAEGLVLKGADRFLRRARPQLLISVHPMQLDGFGITKEQLRDWIHERGYDCRVIAVDHEEHWWCSPA